MLDVRMERTKANRSQGLDAMFKCQTKERKDEKSWSSTVDLCDILTFERDLPWALAWEPVSRKRPKAIVSDA